VHQGQKVTFRVNGQEKQDYEGVVKRVDPAANPTTRQVAVLVSFAGSNQPKTAGLYAEGRIETSSKPALMIPDASIVRSGDKAWAWRLKDGVVSKVALELGERDPRRGDFVVKSGLVEGDKVMRNPGASLKEGQKAQMVATAGSITAGK
jgi:multidrug efflux pump subunit AcrA (membrane-fusion protein)